jgi:hypothetical protein
MKRPTDPKTVPNREVSKAVVLQTCGSTLRRDTPELSWIQWKIFQWIQWLQNPETSRMWWICFTELFALVHLNSKKCQLGRVQHAPRRRALCGAVVSPINHGTALTDMWMYCSQKDRHVDVQSSKHHIQGQVFLGVLYKLFCCPRPMAQ